MKIQSVLISTLLLFSFSGCVNKEPKVDHTLLQEDHKKLLSLNHSYREGEIDAHTYIKQARILNAKIYNQEKDMDAHNHIH